jgi:glyoxylase-like metal-dependent hydrolase (beta-lactamase superfamily II)
VPTDLQRLPLHTVNHSELYGVGRPYSPPLSDIEEDEIAHVVIDTAFDPSSAKNKCFKPPRDKVLNTSWSTAERLQAEAGERVKSLEDLRNKVGVQVPMPIVLILSTAQNFLSQWRQEITWCILTHLNADHAKVGIWLSHTALAL